LIGRGRRIVKDVHGAWHHESSKGRRLCIERTVEDTEVKKKVFKEVDENAPSHTILAIVQTVEGAIVNVAPYALSSWHEQISDYWLSSELQW